jgi:hypothetical protein
MLTDTSRFPRLVALLLDERAFPIDTFRTNDKLAEEYLKMQDTSPGRTPDLTHHDGP